MTLSAEERLRLLGYPPIRGGAPEGDEPDGEKKPEEPKPPEPKEPEKTPEPKEPEPEPEPTGLSDKEKADYHRLKRETAERAKKDREQERKRAEEEGRHADIAKALEAERDAEKERADEAASKLEDLNRRLAVEKVARELEFRDPSDALLHLPDSVKSDDEAAIKRALTTVKKEKPYLTGGQGSRTGAPAGGGTPEPNDLDSQIKAAEAKGDVKTSMRLKTQKQLESR